MLLRGGGFLFKNVFGRQVRFMFRVKLRISGRHTVTLKIMTIRLSSSDWWLLSTLYCTVKIVWLLWFHHTACLFALPVCLIVCSFYSAQEACLVTLNTQQLFPNYFVLWQDWKNTQKISIEFVIYHSKDVMHKLV